MQLLYQAGSASELYAVIRLPLFLFRKTTNSIQRNDHRMIAIECLEQGT